VVYYKAALCTKLKKIQLNILSHNNQCCTNEYILRQVKLLTILYNSYGQLIATISPNIMIATVIQGISFSILLLFGGLSITKALIPIGWRWLYYTLWVNKAWVASIIIQFRCDYIHNPTCPTVDISQSNGSIVNTPISEYLSNFLGVSLTIEEYWKEIGWLILTFFVLKILFFIAVRFIKYNKR